MSDHLDPEQKDRSDPFATKAETTLPGAKSGHMIGPYKLLEVLGRGGMGEVWRAEQSEPVHRRVAIKIVKSDLSGDRVLARFEAERQALALMDHPNIAKVLDAGATPTGRPFFVMELVKGIPFTKFCDQERLPLKARLELFVSICHAVQHAHQKGIIHRDLKPSNVLVAIYDGKAVPKVIDFGVAKAMHQKLTESTIFTEVGQMVGTLEYMAPEQAEVNNLDVDTRADIYSLGVMLYELLVGSTPYTSQQLRSGAFLEVLRLIREVEPVKPSTKIATSKDLSEIAAKRQVQQPARLSGLIRGDLDWIVMKCLEKDRSHRYETADQLACELRRYLMDEPVQAGPPSIGYRAKKFFRRNRTPVIAAALTVLALVAGMIGTTIGMRQALAAKAAEAEQRQRAEDAVTELKSKIATIEALSAEDVGPLMIVLMNSVDANQHFGLFHVIRKLLLVLLLGRVALPDDGEPASAPAAMVNWRMFASEVSKVAWWDDFINEEKEKSLGAPIKVMTDRNQSLQQKRKSLVRASEIVRAWVTQEEKAVLDQLKKPCCEQWERGARTAAAKLAAGAANGSPLSSLSASRNQFWRSYCKLMLFDGHPPWANEVRVQLEAWESNGEGPAPPEVVQALTSTAEKHRIR